MRVGSNNISNHGNDNSEDGSSSVEPCDDQDRAADMVNSHETKMKSASAAGDTQGHQGADQGTNGNCVNSTTTPSSVSNHSVYNTAMGPTAAPHRQFYGNNGGVVEGSAFSMQNIMNLPEKQYLFQPQISNYYQQKQLSNGIETSSSAPQDRLPQQITHDFLRAQSVMTGRQIDDGMGRTSQMSITFDVNNRANTPSGIMREMSLKDHSSQVTAHRELASNCGEMEIIADNQGGCSVVETDLKQHARSPVSVDTCANVMSKNSTTLTEANGTGLGTVLSNSKSQQQQQQQQQQQRQPDEKITTYYSIPSQASLPIHTPTAVAADSTHTSTLSKESLRSPDHTLERLSFILGRGRLVMINFSQRNLGYRDAELLREAILANPQLGVLKLSYNNLGNIGTNLIASAIKCGGGLINSDENSQRCAVSDDSNNHLGSESWQCVPLARNRQYRHHPSLSVLDLGFNNVGDEGCLSLASLAVAHNPVLSTLYLAGNAIKEQGSIALADAIAGGCGLTTLHLTANQIGPQGVKGLMRSMAEFDVTVQMAQQDRENRMALEEANIKRQGRNNGTCEMLCPIRPPDDDSNDQGDDLSRFYGLKCMEELYLGGTNMESTGCLSVSNMLLTNLSLRVLCLSDNGLNDHDLSLFSQSLSRNKQLPLEVLRLSFNKLTCVGVETLMNAIWGSKTLREIKLDNNQIRDRGAQLAAVVLTSVDLEVLDIGFNRLTIVGIKALMKSLAENSSLLALTLSGNVLDTNASKAVSYALAYNKTIRKLYLDHCSLSYAAQRHIAAGIVSNSHLALRVMSGFPLGAISVTLGLPAAMENWTNEQVLKFIRLMWDRQRCLGQRVNSFSSAGASVSSANMGSDKSAEKNETKVGPSDPSTVVAAAKSAFATLGDDGGALLLTEEPQRAISDTSPMVSSDAVMLEKTLSGSVIVPSLDDMEDETPEMITPNTPLHMTFKNASAESLCTANGKECPESPIDPVTKKRNMDWLRLHYRSLHEIVQLPYVYADLIQLHRYFFSPDADDDISLNEVKPPQYGIAIRPGVTPFTPSSLSSPPMEHRQTVSGLQRKPSFRGLQEMMVGQRHPIKEPQIYIGTENTSKRRPVPGNQPMQPAPKRARNDKPRIDYFPRIKAKIEQYLSSSKQTKALILLRQLKFVETMMFRGSNPYCDQSTPMSGEPIVADAEIILIDML